MNINPKVSIIMSVYNGDKYLDRCVKSILNQSYPYFEYIIVDDGSNDNTRNILESINDSRVNIIHQENIGLTASLNKAMLLSKGEYIARQDADDISLPDRLEKQVEFLENHKDYVLIGSDSYLINEANEQIGIYKLPKTDTEIRWTMLFRNPFCHSTVMIRADILRSKNITYNEYLKTAQDYDLWSRIIKFGKTENMENALGEYRVHPDQLCQLYNTEQQNNALKTSKTNLANLGFNLSEEDVNILRKWAYEFPIIIEEGDIYACNLLFRIIKTFKLQPYVDSNKYQDIRDNYISKICNAINMKNAYNILFSSLFINIIRENGFLCVQILFKRILSKIITNKQTS